MSHYYAWVIIPAAGDVDELVAETLAPFDENRHVEMAEYDGEKYWTNPHGIWDWYQIGGRWTGHLAELVTGQPYEPAADPRNGERCNLCGGTGRRPDAIGDQRVATIGPDAGCNGCWDSELQRSLGHRTKWPTQWRDRRDLDVVTAAVVLDRIGAMPDEWLPFTIFTHEGEHVVRRIDYSRDDWKEARLTGDDVRVRAHTALNTRARAGLADRVVVLDYHS